MSRHSTRPSRRSIHRRRQIAPRRRSSGAWPAVSSTPRAPQVAERAPHEVYVDECATARNHLRHARTGQAVEAARRALAALPRGLDAQRLLGIALLELGEARAAAHAFSAALNADPLDVVSHVGIAESQELLEGAGGAEAAWQRAWEVEPGASGAGENPGIGERLQASRRAAGALDVRDGPPPLTRAALARLHLRGRLFEHAAIEARAVLARDPERADVRLTLAEAYWRAGEPELAAAVASEIRERQPDCVAANLLLAAQWLAEGRDVSELMARVQAVDPTGSIAQSLFDDREVPALFGVEGVAEPPAAPPALEETLPLDVVAPIDVAAEPQPVEEPAPELEAEAEPESAPEVVTQVPMVEPTLAPEAETEPESESEPEPKREPEPEPEPEPIVAAVPDAEPEPPIEPIPPSSDDRAVGNAAMADGRYLDAVRAYGAWVRSLRAPNAP